MTLQYTIKRWLIILSLCAFALLRSCDVVWATTIQAYLNYIDGSTVNHLNLEGNFQNIRNVVNGDLDNNNAATNRGFRFYEVLGSLPVAGTKGRIVYITSDDNLYFDNGTTFVAFISVPSASADNRDILYFKSGAWTTSQGAHAQGDILYDDGSDWLQLPKNTTATRSLTNTGTSNNPAWAQVDLTNGVTGALPIPNMASRVSVYYSNATFNAPTGINVTYLTMVGGGGGGCGGNGGSNYAGGGGGGGAFVLNRPYAVVAGNNYTVTVGAGGAGVSDGNAAGAGGTTSFDSLSVAGGNAADSGGNCGVTRNGGAGGGSSVGNGFDSTAAITTAGTPAGGGVFRGGNGGAGAAVGNTGGGSGGTMFGAGKTGATGNNGVSGDTGSGAGGSGGGGGGTAGGNGGSGIVVVAY